MARRPAARHLSSPDGPTSLGSRSGATIPTPAWINAGTASVPGVPGGQPAYFEMLVWDGARWGTTFSLVPKDQLGMTDVVPLALYDYFGCCGPPAPPFTRSAIVPVPEPTTLAIGIFPAAGTVPRGP